MKHLTDTPAWEQIIRDAVQHRTMEHIYYEAGYRAGVRDADQNISMTKST
jgi:hypothetical protein